MCRKFSFFVSLVLVLCLFGNAWGLVWGQKDIGNPTTPGSSSEAAGTWTISGSGHDIWGGSDGLFYVYRPLLGDGSLEFRIISSDNTNAGGWSKAGPAIRETLEAGSKHAMTAMTGANGIQFVYRENTNEGSGGVTQPAEYPPKPLRITRSGDEMISEFGSEWPPGTFTWTEISRLTIPMNTEVTIGMAVSACNNDGVLNTAVLDQLVLTAAPYEKAWDLSPADGSSGLPVTTTLSWKPGDSATSHDVLMGTDPAALSLVATKALGDESYAPTLAEGNTYYWQIVEQPLGQAGPIMRFSTPRDIGAGLIDRCLWEGIGGTAVADLTGNPAYPDSPTWCDQITTMESPQGGDNYGGRMQGLLVPETSGNYTFWIAADDGCELWLSTSTKACEATLISYWTGWTGYRAYDSHAEQKSASIPLVAGESYLIRALWKEGGGGDHCSVAWEGPDAPSRTEIDGYYVVPGYVEAEASILSPADGATLTVEEATSVSFSPGATAVSHNVYFGTDPAALSLVATVAMPDTSAALPALAVDTTYYLMVEADDGTNVYPGCATSFSTVEIVSMDVGGSWGGSATQSGDCWTIVANGGDIWGGNDQFHFVYTTPTFSHDIGTLIANVTSMTTANWWTKVGVMIRETTAGNSKNACMLTTPSDGQNAASFQRRAETGGGSASIYPGGGGSPEWLKLVRNGNFFRGYHSEDGANWTYLGEHNVEMSSFVRAGLAATSHNTGVLTTAEICDFTISTPDPRAAWRRWQDEPRDGDTGLDIHTTLTWNAGDGATQHQVYFSEDEEAVVNRTAVPTILPAETTELYVGPLDLTKTYYWCVDEVCNPVIPGEVLSFTVQNYRTIDNFEAYDVEPEALPVQVFVPGEIIVEAVPPPEQELYPEVVLSEDAVICNDPDRGQVLCLTGGADYVDCGNPAALNFGTGDWTLSAWVKNTMTGTGDSNKGTIVANGGDTGGGIRYALIVSEQEEGEVTLVTDDNTDKYQVKGDPNVNDGVWHHVLGVRDSNTINVYIDGVLEGTTGFPPGYDLSGAVQHNVLIGAITDAPDDDAIYKTYGGMIDDVRIYDYALSTDNALFLADQGGTAPATAPIADWAFEGDFTDSTGLANGTPKGYLVQPASWGPLVGQWEFEGNTDDSTDNHYDGSLQGDAQIVDNALVLDGDGDYVNIDGYKGVIGKNPFTISAWLKKTNDEDSSIVSWGRNSGRRRVDFRLNNVRIRMEHGSGNIEGDSDWVANGEWHHVAVTVAENATIGPPDVTLYFDGRDDTRTDTDGDRFDIQPDKDVGIGYRATHNNRWYNGIIDDVRIYNYKLSHGEIRHIGGFGNLLDNPDSYQPLIGYWKADENGALDSSGNENHGTPVGDATIVNDGERGLVATFDGDGDAIDVGDSELFNFQDNATISVWVNLNSWNGSWGNAIIGKRGEGGQGWQLRRFGGDNRFSWTTRGTGGDDYPRSDQTIDMNRWYHLAAVRDGDRKRLYINGALENTENINWNRINPCSQKVYIGARSAGNNNPEAFFDGKIDELRVYNTALHLGQIRTLAEYVPVPALSATWSGRAAAAPALQWMGGAHEGAQCMRVEYTGSGAVTRLEPFGDGKHPHGWNGDFSLGQAQALSLWFKGDHDNAPGTLFAQLTTVVPSGLTQRVLYKGDPEDLRMPDWKEWNISLKALSTGKPDYPELGLPITKIKDVGIGVIGAGGGVVYFDDLRLQPVRCVPEYGPAKDLDDDCAVDEADLRILIGDWAWQSNPGVNGVRYEYYEDYYDGLANDFDARANTPTKVGVADNFDIGVREREEGFAFRFTAKVAAPETGYYTFYLNSDDGSQLYVDGHLVVDYDGDHGMGGPIIGTKYLTAGLHDIMVTMYQGGGGLGLEVDVSGPGIPRMPIPDEVLFLPDAPDADLNGDGIVNFLDYADILNSYVDEVLWPAEGDLL